MKHYDVVITTDVERQIIEAFHFIRERSPQNAADWLRGLYSSIATLETMPERCPLIREQEAFTTEVRNLLYHSHRLIYSINEEHSTVEVHAFRHAAQDDISS